MKIFHKLFLLLITVSILPLAFTAALFIWESRSSQKELQQSITTTGERSTRAGEQALFRQSGNNHLQIVSDKAATLQSVLETIRRAVMLEGFLARQALLDEPSDHPPTVYPAHQAAAWKADAGSDFAREIHGRKPYAIYHLAPGTTLEAARPALDRLAWLAPFFQYNQRYLPWCKSSYIGHHSGLIIGYPGGAAFPEDYDPRTRYWYEKAVQKDRVIWTKMYLDKDGRSIVMTYAVPMKDEQGRLMGVAAVDVSITEFIRQLFDLSGIPVSDAILMDYKGRIRISSEVGGRRALNLQPHLSVKPPRVQDYAGGAFLPVYRAISADKSLKSGLITPDGRGTEESEVWDSPEIFAFSKISAGMSDEESMDWYYVVRTPVETILKPAGDIKRSLDSFQQDLTRSVTERVKRSWRLIIAMIAGSLLLALLLAFWSARSATRPLLDISDAVKKIADGDYEARLKNASQDEIGQVAVAINGMAKGLKEGHFIKSTFQRYVAPTVVQALLDDPGRLELGGIKRDMTVFFSDIAGFTPLAERLNPETLVELINEYLSAMTLCIFAQEGTIDKYEGDAIMAFWGAPLEQPDHALRACRAALDTRVALKALQGKWRKKGLPELEMRIGLNTGSMVVGNMGSMVKMDYTVLGDAVNLGARLEGANKAYGTKILINESTFKAASASIVAREVDLLTVKGKAHSTRIYELLSLKGGLSDKNIDGYRIFEQGLAAYRKRDWSAAENCFTRSEMLLEGDPASQIFLKRLSAFKDAPPPPDWDGSFNLG